jgi:hypothetical protein
VEYLVVLGLSECFVRRRRIGVVATLIDVQDLLCNVLLPTIISKSEEQRRMNLYIVVPAQKD